MVKRLGQEALPSHLDTLRASVVMRLGFETVKTARHSTVYAVEIDPPATQRNINDAEDALRAEYRLGDIDVELYPVGPTPTSSINVALVHLRNTQ